MRRDAAAAVKIPEGGRSGSPDQRPKQKTGGNVGGVVGEEHDPRCGEDESGGPKERTHTLPGEAAPEGGERTELNCMAGGEGIPLIAGARNAVTPAMHHCPVRALAIDKALQQMRYDGGECGAQHELIGAVPRLGSAARVTCGPESQRGAKHNPLVGQVGHELRGTFESRPCLVGERPCEREIGLCRRQLNERVLHGCRFGFAIALLRRHCRLASMAARRAACRSLRRSSSASCFMKATSSAGASASNLSNVRKNSSLPIRSISGHAFRSYRSPGLRPLPRCSAALWA